MRIMGLDPGVGNTGWGILEKQGNQCRALASGVIVPRRSLPLGERFLHIHDQLEHILQTYHPACAALEDVFCGAHKASAFTLGQAQGILLLVCAKVGIPCETYGANQIKKVLSGFGHAGKMQMQKTLALLLGQDAARNPCVLLDNEHAADALCVALTHALQVKTPLGT